MTYSVSSGVARITLSRPEIHNAFNEVMIEEIKAAFDELGKREDVRAVILSGEGKSFSAGGDIHWMKKMVGYSFEENLADANAMADMLRAIRECPKPVIARVHGAAYGGGVGLTAACDLAIALESAVFCLSEVKLGILPAVIAPYVLEKIGMSHMRRYGLNAEKFNAIEAKRIGLIHEVVSTESEMDAWIDAQIKLIQSNGPEAMAIYKQTLRDISGVDWDRVQAITTRRISERRASPEGQEGLKAFLEKRPPQWTTK